MLTIKVTKKLQESAVLIIPCFKERRLSTKKILVGIRECAALGITAPNLEDFSAKSEQVAIHYTDNPKIRRILFWGLDEAKTFTVEKFRRAAANLRRTVNTLKVYEAELYLPQNLLRQKEYLGAFLEGFILGGYKFHSYKSQPPKEKDLCLTLYLPGEKRNLENLIRDCETLANAVMLVRDLVNIPSNDKHPEELIRIAMRELKNSKNLQFQIFKEADLKRLKMGAILAVGQGSIHPPQVMIMKYSSPRKKTKTILLVGKGVTFDSGGINLKQGGNIDIMKIDLAGAAVVIGLFKALAMGLSLPVNVIGIIGAAENMPGHNAIHPGDVITAYNQKTIEILNTDAEGRLILADCLAYGIKKYRPDYAIDIATLTASCFISLGYEIAGLVATSQHLIDKITAAAKATGEKVWNLPLDEDLVSKVKSEVADIKNVSVGVNAGTIMGGAFLMEFIGKTPWAHLDIAGTGWSDHQHHYLARGGTGWGVRLLWEVLKTA